MLLVHLQVWRLKAFFGVFSGGGLKLILNPHWLRYCLLGNICGLIPIFTIQIIRRTSEFPPVVRLPAIRPLQLPTMYTFWGLTDSLRIKALYQVGCLPQLVSRVITSLRPPNHPRSPCSSDSGFGSRAASASDTPRRLAAARHPKLDKSYEHYTVLEGKNVSCIMSQ